MGSPGGFMNLKVQHGKDVLAVSCPEDGAVDDLLREVEGKTGVLARQQKLIFKGKVLLPGGKLGDFKLKEGSKIMLMATNGTVQTAGQAAAAAAQKEKDKEASARAAAAAAAAPPRPTVPAETRADKWAKTGIVSMRGEGVVDVPRAVWGVGLAARILDLGGNRIAQVPAEIARLRGLQRLRLSGNGLTGAGVAWDAVFELDQLTVLALDHNAIDKVPDAIGRLQQLKNLDLSHNRLSAVPGAALGSLSCLVLLGLAGNQLLAAPPELAGCSALEQLDLSENQIAEVPAAWGGLKCLQAILLDSNRVAAVPAEVLKGCSALNTLSLHSNPITIEKLREMDGFKEYDARRKGKFDKQFDMGVMIERGGFDEGADNSQWRHW